MLELVGLESVAGRKVGTYSGGMRRRIDLVAALMHSPPLLFLDEPTRGLDPQSRLAIWEHLVELHEQGVTILLTTQIMEEADRLCERIAIIDHGRIVADGSPQSLKEAIGGDLVRVTIDSAGEDEEGERTRRAKALIKSRDYVSAVNATEDHLAVTVKEGSAVLPDLMQLLHGDGIAVINVSVASPTLDDLFLTYTGRQIRSADASGDEVGEMMRPWLGLGRR